MKKNEPDLEKENKLLKKKYKKLKELFEVVSKRLDLYDEIMNIIDSADVAFAESFQDENGHIIDDPNDLSRRIGTDLKEIRAKSEDVEVELLHRETDLTVEICDLFPEDFK